MAAADFWSTAPGSSDWSLGFKTQSGGYNADEAAAALNTFTWMELVERPEINWGRDNQEQNKPTGQRGATARPKIGRRSGTVSITFNLASQTSSWDATSDALVVSPGMELLEDFFGGGVTQTYVAGAVEDPITSSDANTLILDSGTPAVGTAIPIGASADAVRGIGWIMDASGAPTYELYQDLPALPVAGDDIYPMRTLYLGSNQPVIRSFRFVGSASDRDVTLVGCQPTGSASFGFDAAGHMTVTLQYTFTDRVWGSSGAVQLPTVYQDLPVITGEFGARLILGHPENGTAYAGDCLLESVNISVELQTRELMCHSGRQGSAGYIVTGQKMSASFTIPHIASVVMAGTSPEKTIFEQSMEDGVDLSLSGEVGNVAGRLFAWLLPSLHVTEVNHLADADGIVAHEVTAVAGTYSGDSSSSGAGNSVGRIAFG